MDGTQALSMEPTFHSRLEPLLEREFPFPLDIQTRPHIVNSFEGSNIADYLAAIHPLIANQRALLRILNDERRQEHQDLKNDSITKPTFAAGDLVI
jgi:hypothetical protein